VAYFDPYVPQIRLGDSVLRGASELGTDHDLVIIQTLHDTPAEAALADCPLVLDLTFRSARACPATTL
jgi:hypothetical protein